MILVRFLKKSILLTILTLSLILVNGCYHKINEVIPKITTQDIKANQLEIITSNRLVYSMVKTIVKDKHNVEYMFNDEKEIWSYHPNKDTIDNISAKDLYIYSGSNLEPWQDVFNSYIARSHVSLVNISRGVNILPYNKEIYYMGQVLKDNPYYWLNIDNYKIALGNIKNYLQERDPKNKQFYEQNFDEEITKLRQYSDNFRKLSSKLKEVTFIVSDDKYDYLFKYLGIQVNKFNKIESERDFTSFINELSKDDKKYCFVYDNVQLFNNIKKILDNNNIMTCNLKIEINKEYKEVLENLYQEMEKLLN